ncbi:MAG TPA: FHA domain-containing protein [Polyangiaceae bacterium]|nr:FHA domain-containing protein [Polyangiaceae bacterium]
MWKLSIEDDQGNKTVVKLVRDEYTIGRAEDNAIRLTERNISRKHAGLRKGGDRWLLTDVQSYNGCYINGTRVSDPAQLEHGDLIQLGDYRLTVVDEAMQAVAAPNASESATIPAVPRSESLLGQPDRLVMLIGPAPGAEFALGPERLVIGRGEECDIAINHSSVSRVHAEVQPFGDGRYEIVDRGSANGVRINGIELQRSLLHPRDSIELGDVVLKYIPAGEVYRPSADETYHLASSAAVDVAPARGIPTGAKIIAGVAGLGVLGVLGMVMLGHRAQNAPDVVTPAAEQRDPTAQALAEATALLKQGNIQAAHELALAQIPEDSNARQSGEFRQIEAAWADALFAEAEATDDVDRKLELFDRIASSTTVDSVRRKRASSARDELSALAAGSVDINELPSAPSATPSGSGTPRPRPADAVKVATSPPTSPPPARPTVARGTEAKPKLQGGLVRDNPFDAPGGGESGARAHDAAERAQALAAKDALKAKVRSGDATESDRRLLRALCRQLGDASCSN